MNVTVVWFANDTELAEKDGEYSVKAAALDLPVDVDWPGQIIVNGYSYTFNRSFFADHAERAVYLRDSDAVVLKVTR